MVAERQRNGISIKIFRRSPRRRYSGRNLSQHHMQWHSSIAIKTRFVLNLLCSLTVWHWKCLVGSMSISGEAYTIWKSPLSTSLHSAAVCLHLRTGKGDGSQLEIRAFVNLRN